MLSVLTRMLVSNVRYLLLTEIADKPPCARAVYNLLPTSQDNISYLVDMVRAKPLTAETCIYLQNSAASVKYFSLVQRNKVFHTAVHHEARARDSAEGH